MGRKAFRLDRRLHGAADGVLHGTAVAARGRERASIACDGNDACILRRGGPFTALHRVGSFPEAGIRLVTANCLPAACLPPGGQLEGRGPPCAPGMWVTGWDGAPMGSPYVAIRPFPRSETDKVPDDAVWVPFVARQHEGRDLHLGNRIAELVRSEQPWTIHLSTARPSFFGFPVQAAVLVVAPFAFAWGFVRFRRLLRVHAPAPVGAPPV